MKVHPKQQQKTKPPPRNNAKKLVHKTIDITLKLISFIGLYFYSLLEPFYEPGPSNFKETTNNKSQKPRDNYSYNPPRNPRIKPRKRNSIKRRRHWMVGNYRPWVLTKMLVKVVILIKIFLHSTEDLYRTDLNRKLYNLVHNT